ncbi:GNAT family N-acetyltransferase [Streptomyces sp. NPDC048442]|uniref:GNAT family N-acetyltransferase n=1 Tax=Streptomyces sp. NPDC048442 TaxID=3154823 RepID=UPI00341A1A3F
MSHAIPDLTTDRLLLRACVPEETEAMVGGKHLPHWAEDFPSDTDRVRAGLYAKNPAWYGEYGHRQMIEREAGQTVGSIGLFWPHKDGKVEFGYGVAPSRRLRGYASEAARALVAHAFTAPGVHTVYAKVSLDNPASSRVLEKAGLTPWPGLQLDPGLTAFRTTTP